MSEHRKLRLNTAGRVVLTSLLTTFFAPALVGVIVEAAKTTDRLQAITPTEVAFAAPGLFPEALTVAVYAWLICWIWTSSPDVLR